MPVFEAFQQHFQRLPSRIGGQNRLPPPLIPGFEPDSGSLSVYRSKGSKSGGPEGASSKPSSSVYRIAWSSDHDRNEFPATGLELSPSVWKWKVASSTSCAWGRPDSRLRNRQTVHSDNPLQNVPRSETAPRPTGSPLANKPSLVSEGSAQSWIDGGEIVDLGSANSRAFLLPTHRAN
jgi:hypothetical protein